MSVARCSRPARVLALCIATGVLLTVMASCTGSDSTTGPVDSRAMSTFHEPDGWWSIDVPTNWRAVRVELDGARTTLKDWHNSPAPSAAITRDKEAESVVYEFESPKTDQECADCPQGAEGRLIVVATPLRDAATLAGQTADALGSAEEVRDLATGDAGCHSGDCPAVSYATAKLRVRTAFVTAAAQSRTYELRSSSSPERWPQLDPLFAALTASFIPGARGS